MASGSQSSRGQGQTTPAADNFAIASGYVLLFVFGLLQGLTGSFQFARAIGPVPLAAIGFALAIGATCALSGRGMGSAWGAICPAAGWLLASLAMAMSAKNETVVITNTAVGQVYLYAGTLCAAIGVGVGVSGWGRGHQAGAFSPHRSFFLRGKDS